MPKSSKYPWNKTVLDYLDQKLNFSQIFAMFSFFPFPFFSFSFSFFFFFFLLSFVFYRNCWIIGGHRSKQWLPRSSGLLSWAGGDHSSTDSAGQIKWNKRRVAPSRSAVCSHPKKSTLWNAVAARHQKKHWKTRFTFPALNRHRHRNCYGRLVVLNAEKSDSKTQHYCKYLKNEVIFEKSVKQW